MNFIFEPSWFVMRDIYSAIKKEFGKKFKTNMALPYPIGLGSRIYRF